MKSNKIAIAKLCNPEGEFPIDRWIIRVIVCLIAVLWPPLLSTDRKNVNYRVNLSFCVLLLDILTSKKNCVEENYTLQRF